MDKTPADFIKEYYEQSPFKEKYSYSEFAEICRAPFRYFGSLIAGNGVHKIMIKYFGKIVMYPSRVIYKKRVLEKRREASKDFKDFYDEQLEPVNKFIEDNSLFAILQKIQSDSDKTIFS